MNTLNLNLIQYTVATPDELDDFVNMYHTIHLKYNTQHLLLAGLKSDEINTAVNRAMIVCKLNGVDTREHFKSVYVFDSVKNMVYYDWRMTRQGFALVIMNAPSENTTVARWQWELANLQENKE